MVRGEDAEIDLVRTTGQHQIIRERLREGQRRPQPPSASSESRTHRMKQDKALMRG